MPKIFLALARVSSREQEREGFSLEVQESALARYAEQAGGQIDKIFRIAETATRPEERRVFRELLDYARANADRLAGVLFYKVDRAARNLFDYVELERLEADYDLKVIYVSQPTENTPAGRMMRRTLANMASFYTEQQSLDVRDGLARRVQAGLFVGKAPYGYRNVRREGRSLVETQPLEGRNIRRIFDLYAYQGHTLDTLGSKLAEEGLAYSEDMARFPRSKLYTILSDRCYLGEIPFKGQWYPGAQEPLIDRSTWERVQALLGGRIYHAHELVFGSGLIRCGECGHPVTGERKSKSTKRGEQHYVYYRCSRYNSEGHSRVRVAEERFDASVLAMFRRMRIEDQEIRDWFRTVIRAKSNDALKADKSHIDDLNRQLSTLRQQQDRLLNLRLLDEIDQHTYAGKNTELRDRIAQLSLRVEAHDRNRTELAELAEKVFELSQTIEQQWVSADVPEKRRLLQIVCLNFSLVGASLVPVIRKPFDVLAEGLLVSSSRGDCRSFERMVATIVDAALSPNAETIVAHRVVRLSA